MAERPDADAAQRESRAAETTETEDSEEAFQRVLSLLKSTFHVDLSDYKLTTIRRRVERRMALGHFQLLSAYADHLRTSPEALGELHDDVFIHVTQFFRDPEAFVVLKERVFPVLLESRLGSEPIRVWVPGCSTGEEAYSIAIALTEFIEEQRSSAGVQIFATDISEAAISRARRAVYPERALEELGKARIERFFEKIPDGYKLRKDVRDLCVMSRHDIVSNPPFAKLDLISCRNVLIYFGPDLQKRIIPVFHYALKPHGFLWLGTSETPGSTAQLFAPIDTHTKMYAKIASAVPSMRLASSRFVTETLIPLASPAVRERRDPDLHKSADHLLLAHPDVLAVLRLLIQSVKKPNALTRKARLGAKSSRPGARDAKDSKKNDASKQYIEQLQHELGELREYQQTLVEQFEASQEELTSANEELQATNEEFQSTNEELETAKEELQSANEELTTTNDELQNRNRELLALNEKLARGEDRFRLMVESVKDYAIFMLDPDGRVASWNEGARRLNGYEASEIIGEHYERFFLPEDVVADLPTVELERARIEGRLEVEAWRLRKDGSRFWANVVVARINDAKGSLIGYSKVTRDLTERKRAEAELEKRERRFRLMISGVREYAIFMLDPEWRVASWNEGARNLKGYEESEILGKHFSVFYPPDDVAAGKLDREIRTVLAEGRVEDEGWRVRKDGSRFWANVVITRVTDAEGNIVGFTKVTRDLTERKRAEEELRRANESLETRVQQRTRELEKALESRDEFLSIASHELKTPLTALKLQLQLARRGATSDDGKLLSADVALRAFDRALRQVVTLEELVEDFLDVSRIQTGRLELELQDLDVGGLVEDVAARFTDQLAQANMQLGLEVARNMTAHWDVRRMTQVLMNVIANAVKYAPGGPLHITAQRNGDAARLIVHDSGPGIGEELRSTIFQRFERAGASPSVGGLGLGLFIARRIVEAHEGTIRVESDVGKGARFVIDVPLLPHGSDLELRSG